jgi:hypothetical protein
MTSSLPQTPTNYCWYVCFDLSVYGTTLGVDSSKRVEMILFEYVSVIR